MTLLAALHVAEVLTPIVPRWIANAICWGIAVFVWIAHVRARRAVLDNLARVAPGTSLLRRYAQSVNVFRTVVLNYYDLLCLTQTGTVSVDTLDVHGLEHLDAAVKAGRGTIIVSAHLGNFNAVAGYPATRGYRTAAVVERLEPQHLFHQMCRLRSATGIEMIPADGNCLPALLEVLRNNGILLVALDREISGGGMPVELFGGEARLPRGPAVLARRTGAIVLPAYTLRTGRHRSAAFFESPVEMVRSREPGMDLKINLERLVGTLERMIEAGPSQWAILHPIAVPPHEALNAASQQQPSCQTRQYDMGDAAVADNLASDVLPAP